jgi:hypothetical protein
MELFLIIAIWTTFAFLCADTARSKNRSAALWFCLAFAFSLIAAVILLSLAPIEPDRV